MIPVTPPRTNVTMKPSTNRSGVRRRGLPGDQRRAPAEDLDSARDHDHHRRGGEVDQRQLRQPGREHVMHPDPEADERGRHRRQRDPRAARPSGGRANVGMIWRDDPQRGQEDDVDVGVAEDPEEVLPEQRVAALRRIEEVEAELPLELEHDVRCRQRGQREQHRERRRRGSPTQNSGIRLSDIPGARSLKIVTMKFDRPDRRRDRQEDEPEVVEVGVRGPGRTACRRAARS